MGWKTPPAFQEAVGGTDGKPFDDLEFAEQKGRITRLDIQSNVVIQGLQAYYQGDASPGTHGGTVGSTIIIPSGSYLSKMEVTWGPYPSGPASPSYTPPAPVCVLEFSLTVTNADSRQPAVSVSYGYGSHLTRPLGRKELALNNEEVVALHGSTIEAVTGVPILPESLGVWLLPKEDVDDE